MSDKVEVKEVEAKPPFAVSLIMAFIPKGWKEKIGVVIVVVLGMLYLRTIVLEEVKASSQHIFDENQAKYAVIHSAISYNNQRVSDMKNDLDKQGKTIHEMNGRMGLMIKLLRDKDKTK